MLKSILSKGRRLAGLGSLVAALTVTAPVMAQDKDPIVFGGSIPLSGVFAFAGVHLHAGLTDYTSWINSQGGINGHPVKYVMEDTGYEVDRSVAAFKKISGSDAPAVYYGDSTGFMKAISAELNSMGTTLMSGASFATALTDNEQYPYQFIPGPNYSQMFGIILEYIASQGKEGDMPTVAFVYSDTEFGKDPIANGKTMAADLGIKVVEEIVTKPGSVDVSAEVLKLRRVRPDYVVFHGYVLSPINEFMVQMRQMGLDTQFMGTFWSSDKLIIDKMGKDADGYMGVMPYNYYDSDETGPMLDALRAQAEKSDPKAGYRPTGYMQGWFNAKVWTEVIQAPSRCRQGTDGGEHGGVPGVYRKLGHRRHHRYSGHRQGHVVPGWPDLAGQRGAGPLRAGIGLDSPRLSPLYGSLTGNR